MANELAGRRRAHSIPPTGASTLVLFAIAREMAPFLRLYPDRRCTGRRQWRCDGGRIQVNLLGVGKKRARAAVEHLLGEPNQFERVIVAGFAGGLRPGLGVGAVLAFAEVVDEQGGRWTTGWPKQRSGRLLTVNRMVGSSAEKADLGSRHTADAVDMESAAVAELCSQRGISFGCLRAISDPADESLSPRLINLVAHGSVSLFRLLGSLARSPRLILQLIRLARQTRLAANNLARRLHEELAE